MRSLAFLSSPPSLRLAAGVLMLWAGLLPAAPALRAEGVDPALLAGMKARSIGPATMSGRVASIDAVAADPSVIYVGTATGGVWKSESAGLTWEPIFEDQPVAAIGAVAIFQPSPDVVWVGTGEGNPRNSASVGNGVYRSLDGGRTWKHLGLEKSERIARILLHPSDPQVAYVAALGPTWGGGGERGVYKTTDGGATWRRILHANETTGAADLVLDPENPNKLIAALWDHRRWPWSFRSGGPGSGLFLTYDGGETWKQLTPEDGLPEGELGRIGLAIAPSEPKTAYALIEAKETALYRSDDGGETWARQSADARIGNRPFYYADLRVDPVDPHRVYSLWSLVSVSVDGGRTWGVLIPFRKVHPDHQAMWIDPGDPSHIWNGNDGGLSESRDQGRTWRFAGNLPVAQLYHVRVDDEVPYNVYFGLQDNGSWKGPSQVWENGSIRNYHWREVGFGDGFDTAPVRGDSNRGFAMSQEGYLLRWNLATGERKDVRPQPPAGETLRFNWNAGFALDPFDDQTIYFGSQYLHKSTDLGDSWTVISPDLTTDNPDWQHQAESGGLTLDVTGAENFTTILAIAPSPLEKGLIWVGTDDGRLQLTRDGGQTWTSLEGNLRGVPANTWIPHIAASPHDAGTAFVVLDDHRRSSWMPYVLRTTDYGKTWKSLVTDDIQGYALAVAQDPVDPDLLFLGTELGLYVSLDGGKGWMKWTHGVPTVSVMDLAIQPREHDLVVGTHGRAVFIVDDIRPLREITPEVLAQEIHLFEPPPAQQYQIGQTGSSRFPGDGEFRGENRPYGALLTFSLKTPGLPHPDPEMERERKAEERRRKASEASEASKPGAKKAGGEEAETPPAEAGEEAEEPEAGPGRPGRRGAKGPKAKVEIRNSEGRLIRTFETPVTQGVNRAVWDLRADAFDEPPRENVPRFRQPRGPEVLPGDYQVTVRFRKAEATAQVKVLADPRFSISRQDREAKQAAIEEAGRLQETVAEAVRRILGARRDVRLILDKARALKEKAKKEEREEKTAPASMESEEPGSEEAAEEEEGESGEEATQQDPLVRILRQGRKVLRRLGELERDLRQDPDAKDIPPEDDALSRVGYAYGALSSSWDAPTPAQLAYLEVARERVREAVEALDAFFEGEVSALRSVSQEAGLELLPVQAALTPETPAAEEP